MDDGEEFFGWVMNDELGRFLVNKDGIFYLDTLCVFFWAAAKVDHQLFLFENWLLRGDLLVKEGVAFEFRYILGTTFCKILLLSLFALLA